MSAEGHAREPVVEAGPERDALHAFMLDSNATTASLLATIGNLLANQRDLVEVVESLSAELAEMRQLLTRHPMAVAHELTADGAGA